MRSLTLLTCIIAGFVTACAPRMIPGTQLEDTDETRAILTVMERYREAVENKNADAIKELAAPTFEDEGGTAEPEDDLRFQDLEKTLNKRFERLDNVSLKLDVRRVNVKDDRAEAVYYYTLRYAVPTYSSKIQTASDIKQMQFKRVGGDWKIVSGI